METLIDVVGFFGHLVYWIGWFGSMLLFRVSILKGIFIGVISWVCWFIVFQILVVLNGGVWIWETF